MHYNEGGPHLSLWRPNPLRASVFLLLPDRLVPVGPLNTFKSLYELRSINKNETYEYVKTKKNTVSKCDVHMVVATINE